LTLSTLQNYDLAFLPPMTWFAQGTEEVFNLLLAGFAGLSIVFLLMVVASNNTNHERLRWLAGYSPRTYMVFVYIIAFSLTIISNTLPCAPLYLFVALAMILTSFIVLAAGTRLRSGYDPGRAIPFVDFCKIHVWLSLLLSGPLLFPFLFFHIPTFNHPQQLVYGGAPLLMVGLYLLMSRVSSRYLAILLGLVVPPEQLPPVLKQRFDAACAPIRTVSDCEIVIARRGLYNAVAQQSCRRITIGQSLIEFLTVEQLRAILTHELGHLEDRVYQPRVNRFQLLGALCFLASGIMTDSRIDYAVLYSGVLILLTIYLFLVAPKKSRMNGERVADSYVLKTDVRLYGHLQAALACIYLLNNLDKDHCKTHDSGHLDLDERQEAVATGKISQRQNVTRRLALLLVVLIVVAGLTVAYSYFFSGTGRI